MTLPERAIHMIDRVSTDPPLPGAIVLIAPRSRFSAMSRC